MSAAATPLPWEVPLAVKLPQAVECIGCGRSERQLEANGKWPQFRYESKPHGSGLCWPCSESDEHDWFHEYHAARAALWAVKRETENESNQTT